MENITLTINGKIVNCPPDTTILTAAERNGIKIPTLCHHHDLEPYGACRLCVVEDQKSGRIMASCVAPVADNMDILTDSPRVLRHRHNIIRMMIAEHPESCLVCSKGNRCRLRQMAGLMGVGETRLYSMPHYRTLEEANPFIVRDLSKCILCGKCIRADHELVNVGAIDYNHRGFASRPATLHERPLEESTCTFCGTCVSMCPTGALMPKNTRFVGSPQKSSPTICGFCGVGCSLTAGTVNNQVVEINPANKKESVNGATLCVRGHFAYDFIGAKERLTQPMIREQGELRPASWDEALDLVSRQLMCIKNTFGPHSVGFLGSSKCTNEENYLFQKIARVRMETNNVDNGGTLYGRSTINHLYQRTAGAWRMKELQALERAEAILLLGANPGTSLPVLGYTLKRASRKGIPLIVADPRKTDLVPFSSVWFPVLPGKDVEVIHCLAALLWKRFGHDPQYIERFTEKIADYTNGLSSFNVDRLCVESGVTRKVLEKAVDLMAGKKVAMVIGHGILQQKNSCIAMDALLNLSMLTGSLGHQKGGVYILAKENNQMGAWDMGAVPEALPGREPIQSDRARRQWEKNWRVRLSPDPGLDLFKMIMEAERGNLKALYIMGENPLRSLPQPQHVKKAFENLEFLVIQDILETPAVEVAHVILPGAAFSEKKGSFTNLEGRIQSFDPVVSPPGHAKADWQILSLLNEKMGASKGFSTVEQIREEIGQFIPLYGELGRNKGVSWVKPSSPPSAFKSQGSGDRISFSPVTFPQEGRGTDGYDFNAILGSDRYHLGSGTRTNLSRRMKDLDLKGEVEISPDDGAQWGLQAGDTVKISSPHGTIFRNVRITTNLNSGLIFIPTAYYNNDVMNLVELKPLGEAGSPGLKSCRVSIEKV